MVDRSLKIFRLNGGERSHQGLWMKLHLDRQQVKLPCGMSSKGKLPKIVTSITRRRIKRMQEDNHVNETFTKSHLEEKLTESPHQRVQNVQRIMISCHNSRTNKSTTVGYFCTFTKIRDLYKFSELQSKNSNFQSLVFTYFSFFLPPFSLFILSQHSKSTWNQIIHYRISEQEKGTNCIRADIGI